MLSENGGGASFENARVGVKNPPEINLAPQPVPLKLDSMPLSKGPFSANIHPISPKLSVPIPQGMCFLKMVGNALRKCTRMGQKSTSNHHKDSGRFLTNPLKVNFPEVISPRIRIRSFPHCKKQRYAKTCISVKLITVVLIANTFLRATEHIINTATD